MHAFNYSTQEANVGHFCEFEAMLKGNIVRLYLKMNKQTNKKPNCLKWGLNFEQYLIFKRKQEGRGRRGEKENRKGERERWWKEGRGGGRKREKQASYSCVSKTQLQQMSESSQNQESAPCSPTLSHTSFQTFVEGKGAYTSLFTSFQTFVKGEGAYTISILFLVL